MKTLACALALVALTACAPAPTTPVDTTAADLKAIMETEKNAEKAWTTRDVNGIMAQYAPTATLVVSGAPPAKGVEAIRGMLTELLKDPSMTVEMQITNTEVSGGIGYETGNYTLHVTDAKTKKPITEKGSSLMLLKKQADGSWKVTEDFNTAAPAAAPAAGK